MLSSLAAAFPCSETFFICLLASRRDCSVWAQSIELVHFCFSGVLGIGGSSDVSLRVLLALRAGVLGSDIDTTGKIGLQLLGKGDNPTHYPIQSPIDEVSQT